MVDLADPTPVVYADFELEVRSGEERSYPLAVRSQAGDVEANFRFPFDDQELKNRLLAIEQELVPSGGGRRKTPLPEDRAVREFGLVLFDHLFTADVRAVYDRSREIAGQEGKGLRLRLRIGSPELATLPWEFLYDPRQGDYVCLSARTPIVRDVGVTQPVRALAISPPLRILGMIANPRDLAVLDTEQERRWMETALAGLRERRLVEIDWIEGQTWRDLQRRVRRSDFNIFYFVGHGGFDPATGEGLVALTDEAGNAHHFPATQLAMLLADESALRLVVLNSCDGARGGVQDVFSSTAAILIRRGIPAVLAMQYAITDRAAIEFAGSFYEAMADGWPVDAAVTGARQAVRIAVSGRPEWGTPVLHLRAPDGVLFQVQRQAAPGGAAPTKSASHLGSVMPSDQELNRAVPSARYTDAPILTITIEVRPGVEGDPLVVVEYDSGDGSFVVRDEGHAQFDWESLVTTTHDADANGMALSQALFTEEIEAAFARALHSSDDRVHVLLAIESPELMLFHWERLFVPTPEGWRQIALLERLPVSFHVDSSSGRRISSLSASDLRALLVVASPSDITDYGLTPLDLPTIIEPLRAALGDIPYDVLAEVPGAVGPPTLDAICERLTSGRYSLLYIACHGWMTRESHSPLTFLYLAKSDGAVDQVDSTRLIRRLRNLHNMFGRPYLIWLGASGSAPLAQQLVHDLGVPAVVAMSDSITIETAQAIGPRFISRVRQHGEVDRALVEARSGLYDRPDILAPVLYSRLRGRSLFRAADAPSPRHQDRAADPPPPDRADLEAHPAATTTAAPPVVHRRRLQVFLSHWSGDKAAVRALYQRLRAEGIQPWLDEEDLLPGQRWEVEVPKTVRASDAILVCLSRDSVSKAGYVQKEIKMALDVADEQPEGSIYVIPLRLEECDVPDRLRAWTWVDYFAEGGHERLMRSLRKRAADLGPRVASPGR